MKKLAIAALVFCCALLLAAPAPAQQPQQPPQPRQTASASGQAASSAPSPSAKPSGRFVTLSGIVAADRKSFLCDKDNRTLAIANPDLLLGIEGQHATLRAHLDSGTRRLLVTSAKLSRDERHAPRLDDAAFRK